MDRRAADAPVISAASGAALALIVAEPTAAVVHDINWVLQTTQHFGILSLVCINKADLHPEDTVAIEAFCREQDLPVARRLPFAPVVTEATVQGDPVTAYQPDSPISQLMCDGWKQVLERLGSGRDGFV